MLQIALVGLLIIAPMAWMLLSSFKPSAEVTAYPPKLFFSPTLDNYRQLVQTTPFLHYTANSMIITVGSTLIGLLLGIPSAFAVSWTRITWPATVTLLARMAPGTLFLLPWYMMFREMGLIGSYWALILTHAPVPAFAALIIVDLALFGVLLARTTTHLGCPPTTWRWEAPLARRLLFRAWPLLLSSLSAVIYLKIDQVMVKLISGPEAAGHYAAATKISEICYLGPVILASALFPAIVRARTGEPALYIRRIRQYFNLSALVAYAVVAPLAAAAMQLHV
jgi:O-antigen/teichoic acid export membrane protein